MAVSMTLSNHNPQFQDHLTVWRLAIWHLSGFSAYITRHGVRVTKLVGFFDSRIQYSIFCSMMPYQCYLSYKLGAGRQRCGCWHSSFILKDNRLHTLRYRLKSSLLKEKKSCLTTAKTASKLVIFSRCSTSVEPKRFYFVILFLFLSRRMKVGRPISPILTLKLVALAMATSHEQAEKEGLINNLHPKSTIWWKFGKKIGPDYGVRNWPLKIKKK